MAEPDPIYQTPATQPTTPPFEGDEGYPVPPSVTSVQVLTAAPEGFPDVREVKRDKGMRYTDGAGTNEPIETIEGGRFDDARRFIYRAYQRYARLLFLHIGVVDFEASPVYAADWDVGGLPIAILGKTWEFAAVDVGWSGDQYRINLTWTGASTNDPRQLTRVSDGMPETSISVGDMVIDERGGIFGQAQILDIVYNGESGGTHTVTLYLDKRINVAREDKAWVSRSNLPYVFPDLSVRFETAVCKHAIRSPHQTFSSFKAAYPSAYLSDGISDEWHCAAMDDSTALIDTFEPFHINTDCPRYEEYVQYLYGSFDLSEIWLARGYYFKMVSLSGTGSSNSRMGLENFPGLLQLGGFLNQFNSYNNELRYKDSIFLGILKHKTGETTDEGYTEFLDFEAIQQKRRDAVPAEDESDEGTFLENMTTIPAKYDAAGGVSSASRLLVDDPDRTPGNEFCQHMGFRRIEARKPAQGEMDPGLSYKDKGLIAGAGASQVQRARKVRRTSVAFTKGTPNVVTGDDTTIEVFASTQVSPGAGADYDLLWTLPRFSDEAIDPQERTYKEVTGVAANFSFGSDTVTIEFEMKEYTLTRFAGVGLPDTEETVKIGGGFVSSDLAHTLLNPGDGSGVAYITDPERRIYPGDQIAFDVEAIRDVTLTCISAKAFSGSADAAAIAPNVLSPGVAQYVRDNYNKRDVAVFELTPENGALIEDYVTGIGASEQDVPIDYVQHGAISPPTIYPGTPTTSTGYAPTVKKTDKATGTTSTVPPSEYVWEPNTGQVFIDSSAWTAGDYVLFAEIWVYDCRHIYPCETSSAYEALIDGICKCYYQTSLSLSSGTVYDFTVDTTTPNTYGSDHEFVTSKWKLPGGVPPYVPFTMADGLVYAFETAAGGTPETIAKEYMKLSGSSTYRIGCYPASFAFVDDSIMYSNTLPAFPFSTVDDLGRWRSDDILEALIEVSLGNAVIDEQFRTESFDGVNPPVFDSGSDTTKTEQALSFSLFERTSPSADFELSSSGLGVGAVATKINISGTDYLRGTIDITSLLKYVLDNIHTEDIEFLLVLNANIPAGTLSGTDLALGWVTEYKSTKTGDGSAAYEKETRTRKIDFDSVDVSYVYIRTDAAELENGPELPRTSAGLCVDNPQLNFDPTP